MFRSILKRNFWEHYQRLFVCVTLSIIELFRYELLVGNVIYNYVHMSLSHYLSDIFTFTHDIDIQETRQNSHTRPLTSLTVKTFNIFLCKGPIIWNIIPVTNSAKSNIRLAKSLKAIVINGYEVCSI
jgi:hypothetical protein